MKKTILLALLTAVMNVTTASETVVINNVKYTKYSDPEIRSYIAKANSVRPEMTLPQVTALLGKPIRDQSVSESPPQHVVVFPLGVVISFYFNRSSRTWLVTAPPFYGSPLCQREDGRPLKSSLGTDIIDYPSISCIPQRFATNSGSKSKTPPVASRFNTAKWVQIDNGVSGIAGRDGMYIDSNSLKTISPGIVEVTLLRSFSEPQRGFGPEHQSEIDQLVISCNDSMWKQRGQQQFAWEMARGSVVSDAPPKEPELPPPQASDLSPIPFKSSWMAITMRAVCKSL